MDKDQYDDPNNIVRMAKLSVKEANMRAVRMQSITTQQLVQRIKDLKYWSNEIDKELQELKEENEDLSRCHRRLQLCIAIVLRALKCNETSIAFRRKKIKIGDERVDRVDMELDKENASISDAIKTIKDICISIEKQIDANQSAFSNLKRDLTLKQEAIVLDSRSVSMSTDANHSIRTPDHGEFDCRLNDGIPLQRMSDYNEWIENTGANLNNAARAKIISRKLAQKLSITLRETAQHLRSQAVSIETLLKDSVRNWQEWRNNLQAQVVAKGKELRVADNAIDEISISLRQKSGPLQVALSRQSQRGLRPGIELCNDKAQHALQQELTMLKTTFLSLENQLDRAKESRKKIEADKHRLQRKLEICEQNLSIDNEILRAIRSTYPYEIQLSGFVLSETKEYR